MGGGQDAVSVVAVQIDAVNLSLGKNPQFCGKIVLKVGVLDGRDVVVADVEEGGGGEVGAQGAVLL